jgi:hypothetical protein
VRWRELRSGSRERLRGDKTPLSSIFPSCDDNRGRTPVALYGNGLMADGNGTFCFNFVRTFHSSKRTRPCESIAQEEIYLVKVPPSPLRPFASPPSANLYSINTNTTVGRNNRGEDGAFSTGERRGEAKAQSD